MAINTITLMGRLTAHPELKKTKSDISVTSFSIAVDRSYAPKGEDRVTDFFNIVVWRGTADFVCKYFEKGQIIALTGELQNRSYEDKDGNRRTATEIVASNVSFAGGNSKEQTNSGTVTNKTNEFVEVTNDEDLPF